MSTADPTGDGGGGPTSMTPTGDNVTPVTSSTGIAISPGSHHQQHPPPSPLSGCYLLVVLPEPHTAQHRDLILNRLAKGFLSWDKDSCHVDLEKELQALVAQAPEGEEARNGERLIQYATENLVTEVLIHPQTNTLQQCIRNLLASFTKHRHIIHAGYTFSGNGSWILQDGTFSLADFLDAFSEHEVQRVLRAYENSVTVDINCAGVGEWSTTRLSKEACTRSCRVRLNPDDVLTAGVPAITSFTNYVGQYLVSQTLDQLMEPSDVVGNIRFSHPTLYVFPGGQGDAALFGINGFNMLVDGGFARKACFWDFARHLDRLDAVLMTRINNSNVGGMSSVLRKKREMHVYPQIGHFFCNLIERRHLNSPDGDKDLDPLILNLTDIGHEMMVDLRHINLRAHPCYRDPNPINLYHKVGHGTLDMYVLNPSKDSREVREFLTKWHASDSKLFSGSYRKDSNNLTFPIQNIASICALLVWQPANPEDTITRILFPGSTPQHKIFEGIERLKHLEFLKHPVCTAKSLSPSTSLLALKDRPAAIKQKMNLIEEPKKTIDAKKEKREFPDAKLSKATEEIGSKATSQPASIGQTAKTVQPAKIDVKTKKVMENKKIETEGKKIEKDVKESRKEAAKKDISKIEKDTETKKPEGYRIKMDNEKAAAVAKETKVKPEPKKREPKESKPMKITKTETPSKPPVKIAEKKQKPSIDKKDSVKTSPSTPKKMMNGVTTKVETSRPSRPITKPSSKQLLSTMPAKSAKDANNRKVVEQKNIENASVASAAAVPASAAKLPAKQKTAERKPIGRRPKPISPIKARIPISPTKSTRSTPTTSVKSDKDGIIRRVKGDRGTTDSSTVSTPSGIEIDSMNKLADKCLTEKSEDMSLDSIESRVLADLKEEREVVEEIEAVLQKAERIEGTRRDDHLEGDDDVTAEATDKKEDDMTEDDVTADIEELPKKESSRKTSHELTEEDEYLIIEKEEIYIEDSVQSAEGEDKHVANIAESEKAKVIKDVDTGKKVEEQREVEEEEEEEEEIAEVSEEKEKTDIPEKQLHLKEKDIKETKTEEILPSPAEALEEQMKSVIASATETVQKIEEKDDSGKKDSEDITKEPSSLSPDKFDSSEKKTTDTDIKPEIDQKDQQIPEKLEESHERMSTLESGATTTAPTLPEDERITLDEIKEVIDEKGIADVEKKADSAIQIQESAAPQMPAVPKPDAKAFEVHPPPHSMQREIVKTPDEVADLPVHEEVDPTLYRMEHFEKAKEEKPIQPTVQQREVKEPEAPPVKEQKGVFSFFGKVADKFEKGIDKLTGKSRRDSEKDIDEKSSSKSGSPKEVKSQNIVFPVDAPIEEMSPVDARVEKAHEIPETFEKGEPIISEIKVAAIKDTATFLKEEIEDLEKASQIAAESKEIDDKHHAADVKKIIEADTKVQRTSEPIFEKCILPSDKNKLDVIMSELEAEDDVEDVQALLEEASKKFKTVKDSLHDSLESLEEKIAEQEMVRVELEAASKDFVKDTLNEVVGKLEDMKPKDDDDTADKKELEKVIPPKIEDFDDEKQEVLPTITKDLKEAVRDVGEVLAGSAGILIEEKPKDVVEIVKKVAEVLKKDDFLSPDVLFDEEATEVEDRKDEDVEKSKTLTMEAVIMPKKVGITEELPPQEEVEEILVSQKDVGPSLTKREPAGHLDLHKDVDVKTTDAKTITTPSPSKDAAVDKAEAMEICADLMKAGPVLTSPKISEVDVSTKSDVMEAGIETICVKEKVEHPTRVTDADKEMKEPSISFDRKVSPVTAEVVMVTPDMSPTSPKLPSDKIDEKEPEASAKIIDDTHLLPTDVLSALKNDESLEKIVEELTFTKKIKITLEIIEYIITIRKIPREKVIWIIEQVIIKKGAPTEDVVADPDLLKLGTVSADKRQDIERCINDEYIMKNKKITMNIVHDISMEKSITRRTLIEIIIEYIVKNNIPRGKVLDISEKELCQLDLIEEIMPAEDATSKRSESPSIKDDEKQEIIRSELSKYSEIKKFIMDELIGKGQRITPQLIDDVCVAKLIPRRSFVDAIERIIIEHKIPRSTIFDISEKELSELLASEKEDEAIFEKESGKDDADQIGLITPEKQREIVKYISDEFIMKKNKITSQAFQEICRRYDIPEQIFLDIIDATVDEHKLDRATIFDISDNELTELLSVEKEEDVTEDADIDSDAQHEQADDEKVKPIIPEKSEIENAIVDEFVSKKRRITPYIFEDICIRYRVSRRVILEIIEEIIVKKNVQRNTILDITDTELAELLAVVEAQGEDDSVINVESAVEEISQDDVEEDKLVDGFVNIPSKQSEKDVDDFEAVEQEYKIHDVTVTPDKPEAKTTPSEEKIANVAKDVIGDSVKGVIEAKEEISESMPSLGTTATEQKSEDTSERSEIIDTTEKYLIEAQEKSEVKISHPVQPLDISDDDKKLTKESPEKDADKISSGVSVQESIESRAISMSPDKEAKLTETASTPEKIISTTEPDAGSQMDVATRKLSTVDVVEEQVKSKEIESTHKSPTIEHRDDMTKAPEDVPAVKDYDEIARKIQPTSPEAEKSLKDIIPTEETAVAAGTVRRMVVTASSEDGGQETEVCSADSIEFTPEDSLKDSPMKTTPDQDSLRMDKESLHSGISTPERDSISEKSVTGPKDGDKITPEDSLDKSPFGTRDSQDLEDSLDKSDLSKLKETEISKPLDEDDKASRESSKTTEEIDRKITEMMKPSESAKDPDTKVPSPTVSKDISPVESSAEIAEKQKDLVPAADSLAKLSPVESIADKTKPIEKSIAEPAMAEIVAQEKSEKEHLPEHSKPPSDLKEGEIKIGDAALPSTVISDKIDDKMHVPITTDDIKQQLDSQQSTPTSKKSSIADEKLIEDVARSSISGPITAKETSAETIDDHVSDVSGDEQVEKTDIHEKSSTVASEAPSPIKHDHPTLIDQSDRSSITDTKDVDKSISQTRSPSPSHQRDSEDKHDRSKRSSVFYDSEPGVECDFKPISPTSEDHKDDILSEKVESLSAKSPESQQAASPTSRVTESADAVESKVIETSVPEQQHEEKKIDKEDSSHPEISPSTGEKESEPVAVSVTSVCAEKQAIPDEIIKDEEPSRLRSTSISSDSHHVVDEKVQTATELTDESRSPSIIDGKKDDDKPSERSSPVGLEEKPDSHIDEHRDQVIDEIHDQSKLTSSTIALDDLGLKKPIDSSTPSSTDGKQFVDTVADDSCKLPGIDEDKHSGEDDEKVGEKDSLYPSKSPKESVDTSRAPSIASDGGEVATVDRSKSPSIATSIASDDKVTDVRELSKSPSAGDANIIEGELTTALSDKHDGIDAVESVVPAKTPESPSDYSSSASILPEKKEDIESSDHLRSPSIAVETQGEKEPVTPAELTSKTPEKLDERETMDGSKSPTVDSDKQDKSEPIDRPDIPSLITEKRDETEPIDRSKSPGITTEKQDEEQSMDRSRTSRVASDKPCEKEAISISRPNDDQLISRSRSSSIDTKAQEKEQSIDRSRSPSIAADRETDVKLIEPAKSPSTVSEKQDEKESIDHSRSSSVAAEKKDGPEQIDRSQRSSIVSGTQDGKDLLDRSRSPSIIVDKQDDSKSIEKSRSPSPATIKQTEKESLDHSRSPSIAGDKQDGKEQIDQSRKSSIVSGARDEKDLTDRSRSPSVVVDKHEETIRSQSLSPVSGKQDEKEFIDRSKSPSIAGDKPDEKERIDGSRSPSVMSGTHDEKESTDRSRSPSIIGDKHDDTKMSERSGSHSPVTEKPDETISIDRSRSPSVATDKQDKKEVTDQPRSPGIVADKSDETKLFEDSGSISPRIEKQDEKVSIDRSRSPSVAVEKQDGDEKIDVSRSPSVSHVAHDEKEPIDRSRASSIVPEVQDEKEITDRSRSPSIVGDKQAEMTLIERSESLSPSPEKQDEKESIDRSRSPSVIVEKEEETEKIDRSQASSIVSEVQDVKELVDRSRSPSIVGDKQDETKLIERSGSVSPRTEKQDEKVSIDRSRSPTVIVEKEEGKEKIDGSRSPSVVSHVARDEKEPTDRSQASSIVSEVQDEKELTDRSRSPSVVGDKPDETKLVEHSGSQSPVTGEQGEKESIERSGSPSAATEKQVEQEQIDRSRISSIASEAQDEKDKTDRSQASSIVSGAPDEKELKDRSRSPSIVGDKQDVTKLSERSGSHSPVTGKLDEIESIDRSKSPTVAVEKQDGKEQTDRSRKSSIVSEAQDEKELVEGSRSPSIVGDKYDETKSVERSGSLSPRSEKQNEKESIDHSRSSSVAGDKLDRKEQIDGSRSPSVLSGTHDEKESIDRSRSPSIIADKQDVTKLVEHSGSVSPRIEKEDEKVSIDRSRSSSVAAEKQEGKEKIDGSRSPSVVSGVHDEKEQIDRSPASSIVSEVQDEKELTDRSRSPSIAGDKLDKTKSVAHSGSLSPVTGTQDEKVSSDRSRSPSVVGEKQEPKEKIHQSQASSIVSGVPDEKEVTDRSRSPSIIGDKPDEAKSVDRSGSLSPRIEKLDEKKSSDRSRSPSVAADKQDGKEGSRSPSVVSGVQDEKESIDRSRSPSIVGDKQGETTLIKHSRSPSPVSEKQSEKDSVDRSRSPSIATDTQNEKEQIDRFKRSSIVSEDRDERASIDRSRSPSVVGDKLVETESIERSISPSIAAEKSDEKERLVQPESSSTVSEEQDVKELTDRSRSPSIVGDKKDESKLFEQSKSPSVATEKLTEKPLIDRSKSPSIAGDEQDEKNLTDSSKAPSTAAVSPDGKKSIERSRSPSIAGEKQDEEEPGTKTPIDRRESSTVDGEKQESTKSIDHPRSPSIPVAKEAEKKSVDHPVSPSATFEIKDTKESSDRSRSPSISVDKKDEQVTIVQPHSITTATEKEVEKETSFSSTVEQPSVIEPMDHVGSITVDGEKYEKEPTDPTKPIDTAAEILDDKLSSSRISSIVEEKGRKESVDHPTSISIVAEKHDEKDSVTHSRSRSITPEKQDGTELIDRSKSPSVVEKEEDKASTDSSRSQSIVVDQRDEKAQMDHVTLSSTAVMKDDDKTIESSRPTTIPLVDHKEDEKLKEARPESPKIDADKLHPTEPVVDLKTAGDDSKEKQIEKTTDSSGSPSVDSKKDDEQEPIDRSRLSSIVSTTHDEHELIESSSSCSIITDKQSVKPIDATSPSTITSKKHDEDEEMIDGAKPTSPGGITAEKKESVDHPRSSSITAEKVDNLQPTDRSKSPSVTPDKDDKSEFQDRSRTSSLATEKQPQDHVESSRMSITDEPDVKAPSDHSLSPQGEKEPTDRSRTPSISMEKEHKDEPIDISKSPDTKPSDSEKPLEKMQELGVTVEKVGESVEKKSIGKDEKVDEEKMDEHESPKTSPLTAITDRKPSDEGKITSISEAHSTDGKSCDIRKDSVPGIVTSQDSRLDGTDAVQALQKLAETIVDKSDESKYDKKPQAADETVQHESSKDRSRSHSLFDADERTPLGRSRTASLFEDKVPEMCSTLVEGISSHQEPEHHSDDKRDQEIIEEKYTLGRSSVTETIDEKIDLLSSDTRKHSGTKIEDSLSKRSSVESAEEIPEKLVKDDGAEKLADVEDYIRDKYIAKKQPITLQIVDEIVTLYSISKNRIFELIEAIIVEKNVPREFIVSFPEDFEKKSGFKDASEDDDVIDTVKRREIESYIHEEFVMKNKTISSDIIDELAVVKRISRHIIIMIIKEMLREQKGLISKFVQDDIFDEPRTETVQETTVDRATLEPESIDDKQIEKSDLPDGTISDAESSISDAKRREVENYIMDECVKKRIRINVLVLEQIISRMKISRSLLLRLIENIIVTRKISRTEMIDDIINDEIATAKSPERRFSEGMIKTEVEYSSDKEQQDVEISEESTSDSKAYEHSTLEGRHYDDEFRKEMSAYANDYESQFHKAFVGGMTEMRTTHITTLSGKSTPEYNARDETPELLSECQTKSTETRSQVPAIDTTDVRTITVTTSSMTIGTSTSVAETTISKEKVTTREIFSDGKEVVRDIDTSDADKVHVTSDITKITSHEIHEKEEPEINITRTRTTVVEEEGPQVIVKKVIREIEEEEPQVIVKKVIREIEEEEPQVIVKKIIREVEEEEPQVIVKKVIREIEEEEPQVIVKKIIREVEEEEPQVIVKKIIREVEEEEPQVIVKKIIREVEEEEPQIIVKKIVREVEEEEPQIIVKRIIREVEEEEPQVIVKKIVREVEEEEPQVIVKRIIREVEEEEPQIIVKKIIREVEAEEPQIIVKKIIREVEEKEPELTVKVKQGVTSDEKDDTIGDSEIRKITRVTEDSAPEVVKTITTKRIETIVTEDVTQDEDEKIKEMTEEIISKLRSTEATEAAASVKEQPGVDVKRIITTVTTLTDSDQQVISHKALTIDDQKTDKHKVDCPETTGVTATSTSGLEKTSDSDKSIVDSISHDEKSKSASKAEKIILEKTETPMSPVIKDLISDQRSLSGKTSPDIPSAKEAQQGITAGKSTADMPSSPFFRDGAVGHPQISGRSTPDKRPTSRSSTATPEGLRSNEIIRTTITTTRTMSEEGDIITTTMEITETTNEKGETIILAEKTDVKVEDRILPSDIDKSAFGTGLEGTRLPTDLSSETDIDPVSPRSDHSSLHSRAGTQAWGSSEERHGYSDDDVPGSPLSTTSQVGYSPQSAYHFGDHSFEKGSSRKSMEFSEADMSSSFYGELPDLPPRVTTMKAAYTESRADTATGSGSTDGDFSFKKLVADKESAGVSSDKEITGKRYIDDADVDFEKALTERREIKREITSAAETRLSDAGLASSQLQQIEDHNGRDTVEKKDPLAGWDSPLGLPSPKPPRKFNLRTATRTNDSADVSLNSISVDPINDWGEPLRLPSPSVGTDDHSNKGAPSTPKKERKQPKKVISENMKNRKRSESPAKNEKKSKDAKSKIQPVYMDLTYVPHHGNSYYTSVEFFKRVRARYYVFSGTEPSREVYDALLDAKKTWEDKDLEVTMIPTYDTDTLGYWVADNEEALAANHIDLSPSASRCTINLQDHETSCSAYRLEF